MPEVSSMQEPAGAQQQLKQPWKEWLSHEIEARKKAEESADAWAAQEELRRIYEENATLPNAKHPNIRTKSPLNKAG